MTEDEILENLNIIKFDLEKHNDVKDAMRELVKSEVYEDVIVGKNTDVALVEEVQGILEAYQKLKDIPIDDIRNIINAEKEIDDDEKLEDKFTYEVIIDEESKGTYRIMRKSPETNDYEEINKLFNVCFNEEDRYFSDDARIYNLLGEPIFCYKELVENTKNDLTPEVAFYDNIYRIKLHDADSDKCSFASYDGRIIYNLDNSIYSKNINSLFEYAYQSKKIGKECDLEYKHFADMLKRKRKYNYLKTWKVKNVFNNYMFLNNKNNQAYYNFDGSVVIDTINSNYVTLGLIHCSDNIITVSSYDANLIKKHGYYSLDTRYEIEPTRNETIYPWYQSGVCVNEFPTYIVKDNDGFKFIEKKNQSYYSVAFHRDGDNKSINKLSDDVYQVYNYLYVKENGQWEDISLKRYGFKYYDKFDFLVGHSNILTVEDYGHGKFYDEKDGLPDVEYAIEAKSGEYNIVLSNLAVRIMEDYSKTLPNISQKSTLNLEKSSFTPSIGTKKNPVSLENSKSLVIAEDKNVDTALRVLIESGVLTERQAQSLILKEDKKQELQVTRKEEILGEDISHYKYHDKRIDITKILAFSEDGSIVWTKANRVGYKKIEKDARNDIILDRETKKVIYNPGYRVVHLDPYGNFIVQRSENISSRMYLLNSRKGTLIGAKTEIKPPQNGVYITKDDNDKYQAYDINGEEKIKNVDKLDWQTKYFVNGSGRLLKTDSILNLENFGYVYAVEEDGDKLIRLPQNNLEILNLIAKEDAKKLEKSI